MIGIGAGAHISIMLGSRKIQRAQEYLAQSLLLILLSSAILGFLLYLSSTAFLQIQGAQDAVLKHGQHYLNWLLVGSPIVLASITLPLLVRNAGAPRLATLAMALGAIANIAFDALFIAVLGYGLEGAALATLLGELISIVLCLYYLFSRRSKLPLVWSLWGWDPTKATRILQTGFSSMLMYLYLSFSVVLHNYLLLQYGTSVHVAAYSIAGYILAFYYLMAEGIAGGMQPLTSFYKGAKQTERIKLVYILGAGIVLVSGVLFVLAVLIFPSAFAGLFINSADSELLEVTEHAIKLFLSAMFLEGFFIVSATWFQALGLARPATLITLSNMAIQIPFLLLLPYWFGIDGVWLAVPISNIALAFPVLFWVLYQWRQLHTDK